MPREEVQWTFHKEFKDHSGIAVRVNILPLRKPIYSFEIGVLKDGGYLNRFFPGGLDWELDFPSIIANLVEEATTYISNQIISEAEESTRIEKARLDKEVNKRAKTISPVNERRKNKKEIQS
jgi:hypothetical protein